MNTYRIHEDNLERLQKKITRIRNKCVKYGCDFVYNEVGEDFDTYEDDDGNEHIVRYILVECEGTAKVNGWKFLATLEHHDTGNIVRKLLDEVEVPERYWTCGPTCEHCNRIRSRNETYVVYNEETGEFKQVGSSCLCDFTGGFSAEAAAEYIALYNCLIEGETPVGGLGRGKLYFKTDDVLLHAAIIVKCLGYAPSDAEKPTRYRVLNDLCYDTCRSMLARWDVEEVEEFRNKFHPDYNDPEMLEMVQAVKEYIAGEEDNSSYIHNLQVLLASEYVDTKNFGYVVSAIPSYNRHLGWMAERKREEEARKVEQGSKYVGAVGDRIT